MYMYICIYLYLYIYVTHVSLFLVICSATPAVRLWSAASNVPGHGSSSSPTTRAEEKGCTRRVRHTSRLWARGQRCMFLGQTWLVTMINPHSVVRFIYHKPKLLELWDDVPSLSHKSMKSQSPQSQRKIFHEKHVSSLWFLSFLGGLSVDILQGDSPVRNP